LEIFWSENTKSTLKNTFHSKIKECYKIKTYNKKFLQFVFTLNRKSNNKDVCFMIQKLLNLMSCCDYRSLPVPAQDGLKRTAQYNPNKVYEKQFAVPISVHPMADFI
jgi:hypothetical protein